jgi:hypothetical protein
MADARSFNAQATLASLPLGPWIGKNNFIVVVFGRMVTNNIDDIQTFIFLFDCDGENGDRL